MRSQAELDSIMAKAKFRPDSVTGGYRNRAGLWVSSTQAREALCAAENDRTWTEDDVDPLSETLAKALTQAGIQ